MFEALVISAALAAGTSDAETLLRSADAPRKEFLNSSLQVRVTMKMADKETTTANLDVLIGNDDQQLVIFRDRKNSGRRFLTVGEKSWLIVPGSRQPIPVTSNQKLLGATTFADIARVRLSEDYSGIVRAGMEPCGQPAQPCRVLNISATRKSAPYAAGMLWIDGSGLLRRAVYRLASGKAAKEIQYRYQDDVGGTIPSGLTVVDLLVPSGSATTTLEYLSHKKVEHPVSTFDPRKQTGH